MLVHLICFQTRLVCPSDHVYDLLLEQLRERLDAGNGEVIFTVGQGGKYCLLYYMKLLRRYNDGFILFLQQKYKNIFRKLQIAWRKKKGRGGEGKKYSILDEVDKTKLSNLKIITICAQFDINQ